MTSACRRRTIRTFHVRTRARRSAASAAVLASVLLVGACADEPDDEPPVATEPEEPATKEPDPPDPDPEEPEEPEEPERPEEPEPEGPEEAPLDEVELTLTPVAEADAPTAGAIAPDGTLHIAERAGRVHPLTDEGLGEPLLDISDETTTDSERGLLGIAFDDERLFVSYTDTSGHSMVDRFDWEDGSVHGDSRETVFAVDQPAGNHNGGDITIGPDGMLWVGLGDGGGAGDPAGAGQDPSTPLGAMLRINPTTGDPADDNPSVGEDADPRVWAYGLRNPWRFTFDRATDDLWIADVGQDDREEINWVADGEGAGANFGWNLMEGTMEFAGSEPDDHWPPIFEYETRVDGCSITGGYVYRGEAVEGLYGAYLFSDYCEGGVRALRHDEGEVTEDIDFGVDGAGMVVSFAQDADGEMYVLTFGDGVLRLDPA